MEQQLIGLKKTNFKFTIFSACFKVRSLIKTMKSLFSNNLKLNKIHLIRFVLVGILNTSFSYLIYATFLLVGLGYQMANFIALVIGILFSFKTHGRLVFDNPDNFLFGRYVLSWVIIYFCTITVIGQIISFGFNAYIAGALSLPFSVCLSYLAQRFYVFRKLVAK